MPPMRLSEIREPDTRLAFPAMRTLRPALSDEAAFVRRVDALQRAEGYRLVGVFAPKEEAAVAVSGFRVAHNLAWGRHIYVDDLATVPAARRRGHARSLMQWLLEEARRLGCDQLHLDSGVGRERTAAHRLYLDSGMAITAHHFAHDVAGRPT